MSHVITIFTNCFAVSLVSYMILHTAEELLLDLVGSPNKIMAKAVVYLAVSGG